MNRRALAERPDALDSFLVVVFLLGIYLEFAPRIAAGVPVPAVLAGIAGAVLLWRHYRRIEERQIFALTVVVGLYLASTLFVADSQYFGQRLKGLLQLTYSLAIGFGLFIVLIRYDRSHLGRIFLGFSLAILVGCALENYTPFRAVSEGVRTLLFDRFLYDGQLRDELLYGGVRPKLFTSEPSYVAYALTLYAFAWYVLSKSSWKVIGYLAILACGTFLVRSPTLVLGGLLIVPYELFLAGRSAFGRTTRSETNILKVTLLSSVIVIAVGSIGWHMFDERLNQIAGPGDVSFFYRVTGPALVAQDTIISRPIAGAGLTGEEAIAQNIVQVYFSSPVFTSGWQFDKINEIVTNFFWHHWIYLGLGWGLALVIALSGFLRTLHVPSILFCWSVWSILGQASGAYVSPKPWTTMLIAAAIAVLHHRQPATLAQPVRVPMPSAPFEPDLHRSGSRP